jgi:hypothetical protein
MEPADSLMAYAILRHWILPHFTTTTKIDKTVAGILMVSNFKKSLSYRSELKCGLPSVTLLGEKMDWLRLWAKATELATFGPEGKMWFELLSPVLARFIDSFDAPHAPETIEFWQKIVHHSGGGSGPTYLSVSHLRHSKASNPCDLTHEGLDYRILFLG